MDHSLFKQTSAAILQEITRGVGQLDLACIDSLLREIETAKNIFCIGAGRSGIMLQAFCMRLNHLGLRAFMLGTVSCPPTGPEDLVIAASGSGENAGVIAILRKARTLGARTAVFTASANNGVSSHADIIVRISAPSSLVNDSTQSCQPMRTLFEQVSFITYEIVISQLKQLLGVNEQDMARRHANLE